MNIEKYLLRKAFDIDNYLPNEILWRKKEAFSDGVSTVDNSWFMILQNKLDTNITDEEFFLECSIITHCKPPNKEALHYRRIFDDYFGANACSIIPHFWLPKWCGNIMEPSARVLEMYM
jgi:asparagine synthase (glutamine-hydrolysing)